VTALRIQLNDRLTVADHISGLLSSCARQMYALRVLSAHGLSTTSLQDVYHATVMSKMLYCSPAWSGLCSSTDIARLDAFVRRSKKLGYCRPETPAVAELFEKADNDLFERINTNSRHVLYQFLPSKTAHGYNTRPRHHNFSLIEQSTDLNHPDFFIRMLYRNMPTEHSFIDIYLFTLLRMSFLLCIIVELRLSTLNNPISDLSYIYTRFVTSSGNSS